ncbi:uncharacterized protein [Halyomorpha halys]|uniref:uncharacterized protein n=1 Tax=Halyomorpha halys TaxID=286706 RepID=UPI0006D50B03|nr:uncharacterized protein LOC106692405 [Halyomorpha halys]
MGVWPFHTCLVSLFFFICCSTALEANIKEPSCEELRAMWRFSKRQSRAAEITNEIPTYRDPFAFNVWEEYARPRSAGRGRFKKPPIYGKVVHGSSHSRGSSAENYPERIRAFEEVMRLFGSSIIPVAGVPRRKTSFRLGGGGGGAFQHLHPSQSGSFQHLKELIRNERARELQEQRMNEETEHNMKDMGKLQYVRMNDSPPSNINGNLMREKPVMNGKGVVAFPDILLPPSYKYLDEYLPPAQKFRHRYPEPTNSIMGAMNQWAW